MPPPSIGFALHINILSHGPYILNALIYESIKVNSMMHFALEKSKYLIDLVAT